LIEWIDSTGIGSAIVQAAIGIPGVGLDQLRADQAAPGGSVHDCVFGLPEMREEELAGMLIRP
jgi:hypothetical protein